MKRAYIVKRRYVVEDTCRVMAKNAKEAKTLYWEDSEPASAIVKELTVTAQRDSKDQTEAAQP